MLAEKITEGPVNNRGGNKELQVTASVTVSAAGEVAQIHIVYKGKRVMAGPKKKHLNDLDSGEHMPEAGVYIWSKFRKKNCI